jgi:membrane glycosyltransferase
MTQTADGVLAPDAPSLTTPTGLQANADLRRRRVVVLGLNLATYAALLSWAATVLGASGWGVVEGLVLFCFALGTPWTVLGFWNALIGLWLLHGAEDAMGQVAPYAAAGDQPVPVQIRTAVLMTVRNEDCARAIRRLSTVKASLDATGEGRAFAYFMLSDTDDPSLAVAEEAAFAAWKAREGEYVPIVYRRRPLNAGFKAGNVRDFCERWGDAFELMLPLDADSLMSGDTIVRLVRMMQAHPRIGILQSLVVGFPSASAFARIFQFGMRHGMRAYTMGQAWWVGDCGPFWGHNALVRIRPFFEDCALPLLPGRPPLGGRVLSHDQVEATLMRRAGYEVRVLPLEGGSWEENPPTMLDFAKRDVRWCQGNMQYLKLLHLPGLLPMSRFQLVWAILMFLGIPAWTLMIALSPALAVGAQAVPDFPVASAAALYLTFLAMYLTPKFAGLADVLLTRGGVARYGGPLRFAASGVIELVFAFLQGSVSTIRTTIFMGGLVLGRSIAWGGQPRDAYRISWTSAARNLWPQTVFGIVVCGALWLASPTVLVWSLPLTLGYLLAVPFCVLTAAPAAGRLSQRLGLAAIPEDFAPPPEITAVQEGTLI